MNSSGNTIQNTPFTNNSTELPDKKEKEIKHLTNEISNMKVILNSYENQNKKITDLEMKLRTQQMNFEKKLKNTENLYKEQIAILNNVIANYEEMIDKKQSIQVKAENGKASIHNNQNLNRKLMKDFNDEISTLTIVNK